MKTYLALVSSNAVHLPDGKPARYGNFISHEERMDLAGALLRFAETEDMIGSSESEYKNYLSGHKNELVKSLAEQGGRIMCAYPGTFCYLDGTEICTASLVPFHTGYLFGLYADENKTEHLEFFVRDEDRRLTQVDPEETRWRDYIRFGSKVVDNLTGESYRVVATKEDGLPKGIVGVVNCFCYDAYCTLRNNGGESQATDGMLVKKNIDELHTGQEICIRKYLSNDHPFPEDFIKVMSGSAIRINEKTYHVYATTDYYHFYLEDERGGKLMFHIDEFADWIRNRNMDVQEAGGIR